MTITQILVATGAIISLALLVQRPQRGLLLLAALAPLHGLLVIVPGGRSLSAWKEVLLLLTLTATFVAPRRSLRTGIPLSLPWWPAVVGLVLFGSASALVTAGATGLVAIKITFFYLLVLLVLWRAPFSVRERDHVVTIVMALGLVTSVVGLWQQVVGAEFLVGLGYDYNTEVRTAGGFLRSFSTFNQPFPFGLFVMMSLLVGGAVALAEPRRRRNAMFLLATPVLVAGMAVSIVRASYLGLAVGVLWMALHRYRHLLTALAVAALSSPVALLLLPGKVLMTAFSSTSFGQRSSGWSRITSDVLANPLGRGLGSSGSAAEKIASVTGRQAALTYQPDNYYVKLALELGPIGLWLFVLVLISGAVSTLRASRVLTGQDAALALGVSASVVAAGAASLVATYFEIFPLDVYYWLLLGVVGCAVTEYASGTTRSLFDPVAAACRPMPVKY